MDLTLISILDMKLAPKLWKKKSKMIKRRLRVNLGSKKWLKLFWTKKKRKFLMIKIPLKMKSKLKRKNSNKKLKKSRKKLKELKKRKNDTFNKIPNITTFEFKNSSILYHCYSWFFDSSQSWFQNFLTKLSPHVSFLTAWRREHGLSSRRL